MTIDLMYTLDTCPDRVLIPVPDDEFLPGALAMIAESAGLDAAMLAQDFKAEQGEILPLYGAGRRLFLLGMGKKPGFAAVQKAFRSFAHRHRTKLGPWLGISFLHGNLPADLPLWVEAALNGLVLGTYRVGRFKASNDTGVHPLAAPDARLSILLPEEQSAPVPAAARRGEAMAETQLRIFDLVNAPGNKKIPSDLGAWALASGREYGYRVEVFDRSRIEKEGLQALLAVSQGSEVPPVFIIMEYQPVNIQGPLKKIGLVGKGVTFDTGGLSIKPSANMHYMKSDMGGAAAVFGVMELAARWQLPVHLIGIVPATENSVDARSLKPGDVIGSYSGKTIEVIDTDAEGRLILADGLSYMVRHFQPEVLIDLATLTGSAVRTFGYHAGGLFANDDQLAAQLSRIGDRTGERIWRLPLWDVYQEEVKSDVADVRNFSGRPTAGAIAAAKFLEAFIGDHPAWAHLDIAGVAFCDSEFASQKIATAFGVRLLVEFLEEGMGHGA